MYKRIIIPALLLLAAVSFSLAFCIKEGWTEDRFTYGGAELRIVENTLSDGVEIPFAQNSPVPVSAGEYSRIVRVKNTGEHPVYVRASLSFAAADSAGQNTAVPEGFVSLDINTDSWKKSGDWYYYESAAVAANEETEELLTKIIFDNTVPGSIAGGTVTVHIRAEAVQSENNGSTVWQAEGWPAVKGGRFGDMQ